MRTAQRSGPHGDGPDRLGIGDLMTLWAEQPSAAWNIAIAGLLDRDALPDSDEALREEVERRLDAVPQLRRRLLWTHVGAGRTVWIDDPHFDVADHVRIVPLHDASTTRFLDWAASWAARPLDRSRPLWRMVFVTGLRCGDVGVVIAVHHAVADGVAGAALVARLMDGDQHGTDGVTRWRPTAAPSAAALRADAFRMKARAIGDAVLALPRWARAARTVRADIAASAQAVKGHAPDLQLPSPSGTERRLVAATWPLEDVKRIGRRHGATVNDVVLTAVAAGLRRLLADASVPVVRVSVPVAAPPGARNAGGTLPMVLSLPVAEQDPVAVLRSVTAQTAALKASRDRDYPGVAASPLMPVSAAWAWTRWLRRYGSRRINLFVTNVPGPKVQLRFLGAPLRAAYPVAPVVAGVPLAVAVMSYAGTLVMTVNAGVALTGLDRVVEGADEALERLLYGTMG